MPGLAGLRVHVRLAVPPVRCTVIRHTSTRSNEYAVWLERAVSRAVART
jgi:hypothetical protein